MVFHRVCSQINMHMHFETKSTFGFIFGGKRVNFFVLSIELTDKKKKENKSENWSLIPRLSLI